MNLGECAFLSKCHAAESRRRRAASDGLKTVIPQGIKRVLAAFLYNWDRFSGEIDLCKFSVKKVPTVRKDLNNERNFCNFARDESSQYEVKMECPYG